MRREGNSREEGEGREREVRGGEGEVEGKEEEGGKEGGREGQREKEGERERQSDRERERESRPPLQGLRGGEEAEGEDESLHE